MGKWEPNFDGCQLTNTDGVIAERNICKPRKLNVFNISLINLFPNAHQYFSISSLWYSKGLLWWLRWQRICLQCGRPGFDPWVRKIPWRREGLPTPVFMPAEFHGHRNLAGYSPAAAAKSLQSCSTLCDPRDGSLPGSSVHGIFQARVLEWVASAFSGATVQELLKLYWCYKF